MTMHSSDLPLEGEASSAPVQLSLAHLLYRAAAPTFLQPLHCGLGAARGGSDKAKASSSWPDKRSEALPLLWQTLLTYRQLRKSQLVRGAAAPAVVDDALLPLHGDAVKHTLAHVWHALCRPGTAITSPSSSPASLVSDHLSFSCPWSQLPSTTLSRGPYTVTVRNDSKDTTLLTLASCEVPELAVAEELDAISSAAPDFVHVRSDAAAGTVHVRLLSVETAPALLRARERSLLLYVFLLQDLLDSARQEADAMVPVIVDGAVCLEGEPATAGALSDLWDGLTRSSEEDTAVPASVDEAALGGDVGSSDQWRHFRHLTQHYSCFSLEDVLHSVFHDYVDPLSTMIARCHATIDAIAASTSTELAVVAANKAPSEQDRLVEQQQLFQLLQWQVFATSLEQQQQQQQQQQREEATNVPKDGPLPIAAVILPEPLRRCYRACSGTELPAVLITLMNAKGSIVHFYDDEAVGLLQRALKGLHAEVFVYDDIQSKELFKLLVAHQRENAIPVVTEAPFREQVFELERLLLDLEEQTAAEDAAATAAATTAADAQQRTEEGQEGPVVDSVLARAQRYDPYTVLVLQRHKKIHKALRQRAGADGAAPTYTAGDVLPPHFYSFVLQSLEDSGVEYGERISSNLLQAARRVISKFNQRSRALE